MEKLHERMQAASLTPSRAALGVLRFAEGLNRSVTLSHLKRAIDPGGAAAFSAQVLRRFATLADPRPFTADIAQRYTADEAAAPATTLPFRLQRRSDLPSGVARWSARRAASDSAPTQPDAGAPDRAFGAPVDPLPSTEPLPSLLDELSARGWGGPLHHSPGAGASSGMPAMTPHLADIGDRPAPPSAERTIARQPATPSVTPPAAHMSERQPAAPAPAGAVPSATAPVARASERQPAAPAPATAAPSVTPPAARVGARQPVAAHPPSDLSPDTMHISRAPHTTRLLRESWPDPISRMGIALPDAPSWSPALSPGGEPPAPLPLRRIPSVERSAASDAPLRALPPVVSRSPDVAAPSLPHRSPDAVIGSGAALAATTLAADAASQEGSTPDEGEAAPAPTLDARPAADEHIPSSVTDISRTNVPVPQPAALADAPSAAPAPDARTSAPETQRSPQSGSAPGLRPSPLHLSALIARRYHLVWREGEVQQMPLLRSPALSPAPVRSVPMIAYRTPGRSASAATSLPAMRSAGAPLIAPATPSLARGTQPDAPAVTASDDAPDLREPSIAPPPGFAPAPLPLARAAAPDPSPETPVGRAAPARLVERPALRDAPSRLADGTAGVRAAAVLLVNVQRTAAGWQPFAAHAADALPLSAPGSAPAAESSGWFDEERPAFHESARQLAEPAASGSARTFAYRSPFADAPQRSGAGQQSRHTELTVARHAGALAETEPFTSAPAPALGMIAPRRTTAPAPVASIYRAVDDTSAPPQTTASAEQPQAAAAPSQPQDIEKIAQQVYDHLRRRLLIDQERRGRMF
ncbi:MAG: hypothetical protein RMJ55_02055 [Roseiflexaceae bacterium]|nr:hypothetical protein [Roseiflexaceae bacterium]